MVLHEVKSAEAVALKLPQNATMPERWIAYLDVLVGGHDLGDQEALSKWSRYLPIRDCQSVALKKLGGAWMANCSKKMFATSNLSVAPSLRKELHAVANGVRNVIQRYSATTRMFVTDNGYLGTGPEGMYVGDVVCVLYRGNVPFILRETGSRGHYILIGEAYVHGIMQGEAMGAGFPEQDFLLI
ncbi:hypothetical protein LTR36_007995 [Oleoguttula mirabilis]|uniref:Heterokaryon incompatibility protein 6 n=1 Tax=Oleoguttula mirabilis TaxID=1507867 RepID=A0AAV9J8H6_9PEZI|nr:hypothetical protein LTR36_007995 [Oleoguttula mirabilis]